VKPTQELITSIINDVEKCKTFFADKNNGIQLFQELYGKYSTLDNFPNIDNNPLMLQHHPEFVENYIRSISGFLNILLPTLKEQVDNSIIDADSIKDKDDKVFIVHGKDNEAKQETARFIEKLGLKAIILHEQVSGSKTIIEKIEEYSNVGYAIVLYTPCDVGNEKNKEPLNLRARQNVVFEHGYFIGKLGRKNVCALVKGSIEKPNDISGVVYIQMDNNGNWKMDLAREMKSVGYQIDLNRLL